MRNNKPHHDLSLCLAGLVERIFAALGAAVQVIAATSRRYVAGKPVHAAVRAN